MALNAAWHEKHPMPAKPTFEQRVRWHEEHARECGCRKPPADIAARLAQERAGARADAPAPRSR
jgi:hypothetical protein